MNRSSATAVGNRWMVGCTLLVTAIMATVAAPVIALVSLKCPGLEQSTSSGMMECTRSCQQTTCAGLHNFFNSTYNTSNPEIRSWRYKDGWEALLTQTCDEILATPTDDGLPSYCGWFGVACCPGEPLPVAPMPAPAFEICNTVNSVTQLDLQVNGLNGSIAAESFQQSVAQLHACGMTRLILTGNALSGSLTDFWGELGNLTVLNLAKNMIEGTIPDALRRLIKLTHLELDRNPMYGTLPEWLSELQSLRWLGLAAFAGRDDQGRQGLTGTLPDSLGNMPQLAVLVLGSNSLTGSLPARLCHPAMVILDLQQNQLQGELHEFLDCSNIFAMAINNNKFTGFLPQVPSGVWLGIYWLDISGNQIEGPIPYSFYKLPGLTELHLANNRLNGSINNAIGRMQAIMVLNFGHNQLTGPLEESVWNIRRLSSIDFSNNRLTGTLSPAIGMSYHTASINLGNNMLQGRIPTALGLSSELAAVDLRNNSFSCSGVSADTNDSKPCDQAQVLPCFLQLSPMTVPRPDASNMECPMVVRKAYTKAVQDCSGHIATQLGGQANGLANITQDSQHWSIDPSYYQYSGCKCLGDYNAIWSQNNTVLACVHTTSTVLPPWLIPLAVVFSFLLVTLMTAAALVVWLRVKVLLRRRWQREKELLKNRLKGVPNGGPASIVVTDVESYSELMQRNAVVTTRAMGIHNAILRKAVTAHAGHVIEQEGDSWSVAFHRSVDAVAFCLQVQQALQKSHWPAELAASSGSKSSPERNASNGSALSDGDAVVAEVLLKQRPTRRLLQSQVSASVPSAAKQMDSEQWATGSDSNAQDTVSSPPPRPRGVAGLFWQITGLRSSINSVGGQLGTQSSNASKTTGGETAARIGRVARSSISDTAASWSASLTQQRLRRGSLDSVISSDRETSITQAASKAGHRGGTTWMARGKTGKADVGILRGLKVRMGVASGWIPAGSDITRTALFEVAKAVSDMANGGQILLELATATAVREWLTDLGSVDHKGYNDKLLLKSRRSAMQQQARSVLGYLTGCFSSALQLATHNRDAVLLDMGQFWVPSLGSTLQTAAAAAGATKNAEDQTTGPVHRRLTAQRRGKSRSTNDALLLQRMQLQMHGSNAAVVAAATALVGAARDQTVGRIALQLYSVLARPLSARSKVWKSKLKVPPSAQQMAKGYFEAPGTVMADLNASPGFLDVKRPLLPPVVIVFAAVEGGKMLVHKKEQVAAVIHNVVSWTMQALLLSLPDGYLCREQEAVLKYMVAFQEPTKAMEWCIMMQEVLQHVSWPVDVLEAYAALPVRQTLSNAGGTSINSNSGVGDRPRLKMGLAEGVPGEIAPDHLGRADYFGTSVNLAARIASAAAHPGQIVMSLETAQNVFSAWRYEAELSPAEAQQQQQQRQTNGWEQATTSGVAAADVTLGLQSPQHASQNAVAGQSNVQDAQVSDRATLLELSPPSRGLLKLSSGLPDTKSSQMLLQPCLSALPSTELLSPRTPRMAAALAQDETAALGLCSTDGRCGQRRVHVSCHHNGTYAFKGCGALDMVCVTSDVLAAESRARSNVVQKGSKGVLIMPSSGPVLGLHDCPVMLPNTIAQFQHAWAGMSTQAAASSSTETKQG